MQRLLLIILSSFFLMVGCKKSLPEGILSEKKMVEIMTEVHLVDGYLNTLPVDSSRRVIEPLYQQIFDKYAIDSIQFKQNITYYLGNPVVSKELYETVSKNLSDYEKGYRQADSIENARVSDSIRLVQHYTQLKDEARRLILDVHIDTIPYSYKEYKNAFLHRAGLDIKTYEPLERPAVVPSLPSTEPSKRDIQDPVATPVPQRIDKPERKPVRAPGREKLLPPLKQVQKKPVAN